MAREQIKVPYGYEPPVQTRRGTVLVMETFEDWLEEDMRSITAWAEERKFARVILYPQHEETLRRMGIPCEVPYFARVKQLEALLEHVPANIRAEVDRWEGKRKKYTPIDTSLHFLTDKYVGPFFVAMSDRYANVFVTYASFAEWIKKVRLVVQLKYRVPLNGKLEQYASRWEAVE